MTILSKTQKETVAKRLQAGNTALEEADLLYEHQKYQAVNSRIFAAICHFGMALLAFEEVEANNRTEMFSKIRTLKNKELKYSEKDAIRSFEKLEHRADFELNEISKVETDSNLKKAKQIAEDTNKILTTPSDLVPDLLELLKKHDACVRANKTANLPNTDSLIRFVDLEFLKRPKAKEAYKAFVENSHDLKAEGAFEITIENALEMASEEQRARLEDLCSRAQEEMKRLDAKTFAEKPAPKPAPKPVEQKQEQKTQKKPAQEEPAQEEPTVEPSNKPIILPWDFTDLANIALEHAVQFTVSMKRPLKLLHIVKKNSEVAAAKKKLHRLEEEIKQKHNVVVESLVQEGNIFDDISRIADEQEAELVVMGTHGVKGMQKITGSWALKVIVDTKAPFVVIQEKPHAKSITNIVVPITPARDMKKLLNEIRVLDEYYKPTFRLIRLKNYPNERLQKQAISNFVFFKSFMRQEGIKFEDVENTETRKVFDAGIEEAIRSRAELMMILTTKDINTADYLTGVEEQRVIANTEKISVMCVNPLHSKYSIRTNLSGY